MHKIINPAYASILYASNSGKTNKYPDFKKVIETVYMILVDYGNFHLL